MQSKCTSIKGIVRTQMKRKLLGCKRGGHKYIFVVAFYKRTTGELRVMKCRFGVRKHLRGGRKPYRDEDKNLITVFDMDKVGYRSIPFENIVEAKINGSHYVVKESPQCLKRALHPNL